MEYALAHCCINNWVMLSHQINTLISPLERFYHKIVLLIYIILSHKGGMLVQLISMYNINIEGKDLYRIKE